MIEELINYLRPIWEDNNNEPSIRRVLALIFTTGIIRMVEHSYKNNCLLDANVLMVLCGMIAALLALTTWQNTKIDSFKQDYGSNINKENTTNTSETQGKLD